MQDKSTFKREGKTAKRFTPMNTHQEKIWCEVLHLHNIHAPPSPMVEVMGLEPGRWCKFHRVKVHHTEDSYKF